MLVSFFGIPPLILRFYIRLVFIAANNIADHIKDTTVGIIDIRDIIDVLNLPINRFKSVIIDTIGN